MGDTIIFRTLFARVLTIGLTALAVLLLGWSAVEDGVGGMVGALPVAVTMAAFGWVLFGNPKVKITDDGVTVVNILRTVEVSWRALQAVESRWSLTLETTTGSVSSWAVPAASGTGQRLRTSRLRRARPESEAFGSLSAEGHNAEAAALAIGERLRTQEEAGRVSEGPAEPTGSWNIREVLVLAVAVVAVGTALLS